MLHVVGHPVAAAARKHHQRVFCEQVHDGRHALGVTWHLLRLGHNETGLDALLRVIPDCRRCGCRVRGDDWLAAAVRDSPEAAAVLQLTDKVLAVESFELVVGTYVAQPHGNGIVVGSEAVEHRAICQGVHRLLGPVNARVDLLGEGFRHGDA